MQGLFAEVSRTFV